MSTPVSVVVLLQPMAAFLFLYVSPYSSTRSLRGVAGPQAVAAANNGPRAGEIKPGCTGHAAPRSLSLWRRRGFDRHGAPWVEWTISPAIHQTADLPGSGDWGHGFRRLPEPCRRALLRGVC